MAFWWKATTNRQTKHENYLFVEYIARKNEKCIIRRVCMNEIGKINK